jgi:very-short-patch-repair endonuclease
MPDDLYDGALRVFRHHQARRERGIPTIRLLIAEGPALPHPFEIALEAAGLQLVYSSAPESQAILRDWRTGLEAEYALEASAFAWLSRALGTSEAELRASWAARSDAERLRWLEQRVLEDAELTPAVNVLRAACTPVREVTDAGAELHELLSILPSRDTLVLCLESAQAAGLRALLGLAVREPRWPMLAVVERAAWPEIQAGLDSRSRTLLDEGLLPAPARASVTPGVAAYTQTTSAADGGQDVRERAVEAIATARAAIRNHAPDAETSEERARSLAELRLYQLLQADPVTTGLFDLNLQLPFTFGPRRAEVDLASLELRLAVEVDGYHHFREFDGYRRDRRKDVLLQHHGYLVSRHLAADVVERPGEVVRTIRQLVLRRKRSLRKEKVSRERAAVVDDAGAQSPNGAVLRVRTP